MAWATLAFGAAASGATPATAGLFGVGGAFSALQTLSTAGTAFSAMSAIRGGGAANQAAQMQAQIYQRQADRERESGQLNARRQRQAGEKLAGTQRALLAGGGGDQSTGSALLIQEDLAQESEFNARLAENNAEAAISTKNAEIVLARAEGRAAQTASYYRAGTTLLKGAKSFAGDFGRATP